MSYVNELISHCGDITSFETDQKHTRCSGCGNYGMVNALMQAIALEGYKPHEVVVAFDVWCSWNLSDKFIANTIHGLHGRVLPLASWIHCANPEMPVLCMAGDGATMSEWVNHLIHTARNNYNITFILNNNHNYGLTTGQASATTPKWCSMKATVGETTAFPLEPLKLVLASWGTFAARWFSGNVEQLTWLIRAWMNHQGFSIIEIMQHCPTFWKATPLERYEKRVYDINERDDYDNTDKRQAMKIVENVDNLATWILYQDTSSQWFLTEQQSHRTFDSSIPVGEVDYVDMNEFFGSYVI